MRALGRILREPLVHFFVLGLAVFVFYNLVSSSEENPAPREIIVVSEGRVQQLAEVFARTWQRAPTPEELRGLIDAFVKEEIYYREAVKQGLDRDDTVIRRRMQQKMEFLIEPPEAEMQPEDAELEVFLADNRERFRSDAEVAFRQVYFRAEGADTPAAERAAALLEDLRRNGLDGEAGDPTLLPVEVPLTPLRVVARTFGDDFAANLAELPAGDWAGPVVSPYGLHLVLVSERRAGYDPPLAEVRAAVLKEWQYQKWQEYSEQAYRDFLARYEVVLPEGLAPAPASGAAQ